MPITISPDLFDRLSPKLSTRKFAPYAQARQNARLLLLSDHPDFRGGRQQVLALLFDMNALWEGFVATALRRHLGPDSHITTQARRPFWRSSTGTTVSQRPDFIIEHHGKRYALDTKWKVLGVNAKPSADDLRQLYAYSHQFECADAALIYPGAGGEVQGAFAKTLSDITQRMGHLLQLPVSAMSTRRWMQDIAGWVRVMLNQI